MNAWVIQADKQVDEEHGVYHDLVSYYVDISDTTLKHLAKQCG